MSATTKGMMVEQVKRLLAGGNPQTNLRANDGEIAKLIEQGVNAQLKATHFAENLPEGDMYPRGVIIATYDEVPVVAYKDVCKCTLPVNPIGMPRGMGVWHVSDTVDIFDPYIPLRPGINALIKGTGLLGELSGLTGYEWIGRDLVFTKNILPAVENVYLQLLVADIASLDDYDILPITADIEALVVNGVYELLSSKQPADRVVDANDKA